MKKMLFFSICIIGLGLSFQQCTPMMTKPIYQQSTFSFETVDTIYLLPFVDARVNKNSSERIPERLYTRIEERLNERGFTVVRLSPKGWKTPINDDDLPKTDSTRFLKFEGLPAQTHWALLPVLLDHKLKVTFRATATTELEAYLFDYRKEQLVWHDKSIGSNMQGVLFGWEAEIRAKNEATDFLTNSIPTKINKTKASYR